MSRELRHQSFRLPAQILDRLRQAAARRSTSQTALAARYIEEGLRMDDYPMIVFRESPLGRRPMLEGTRLDVAQVVATLRESGGLAEDAAEYLALSVPQIRACVRYYADHRDEIDEYAARVAAENERLRAAWERERAVLGS